jgi:hypothetical protein
MNFKYYVRIHTRMARNNANARIRRKIAEILFDEGPMTRSEMTSRLLSLQEFRILPNDSSLTAMLCKNAQIIMDGWEYVEVSNGVKVKNALYRIDDEIIKDREDLIFTLPVSSMTRSQRERASVCPKCRQRRIIEERWSNCLTCQRRGL